MDKILEKWDEILQTISIIMFFVYKKKRKTKWVAYEDMDLSQPEDMEEARKHMSGME